MEQLTIVDTKKTIKTCTFTGHRELGKDCSSRRLKKEIENLILRGTDTFYNGGAMGFDLLSGEITLKLRKKYPQIRLIVCIPCYGQEKYYSERDKKRYCALLKGADEQVVLSPHYYKGCMQVRDKYMAEHADVLVTYCKEEKSGTGYTIRCFLKKNPCGEVIYINKGMP